MWQKNSAILGMAIALTSILTGSAQAAGLNFSKLYVFGDSLVDTGNVFNSSGGVFPPAPYAPGRFSNGPIWIDDLAAQLGLSVTPVVTPQTTLLPPNQIVSQSVNFGFGGATTTANDNTLAFLGLPSVGLQQEVQTFVGNLQAAQQTADPDALYILWAGADDYLPTESPFVPFKTTDQPIANISTALSTLIQSGARKFLVPNLPDLGEIPLTRDTTDSQRLQSLSNSHNLALKQTLTTLSETTDAKLTLLDINTLFQNVVQRPDEFGFTNVTDRCLNLSIPSLCPDPNQYLFWDELHPTSKAHQIIAQTAYETLNTASTSVPEPVSSSALLLFGGSFAAKSLLRSKKNKIPT
jgi:phospholipase/lecithinase/hemolysin